MLWNDSSPIWVLREPVFWRKPLREPEWDHLHRCLLLREPPGLPAKRILRLLLFLLLEYFAARSDLCEQLHGLRVQWRLRLLLSCGLFPRGRWERLRLLVRLSDDMLVILRIGLFLMYRLCVGAYWLLCEPVLWVNFEFGWERL